MQSIKKKIYNTLFALFWGIGGYTLAFIILETLFYFGTEIIELTICQDVLLQMQIALFYGHTLTYLGNSFVEEIIRFKIIKKLRIINPYGLLLGLSWGGIESIYRFSEREGEIGYSATLMHIFTAGIVCYFVKKNKPILGLVIAFLIHTTWNILVGLFPN